MTNTPKFARLHTNNKWASSRRYSNDKFASTQYEEVNQFAYPIRDVLNYYNEFYGDGTALSQEITADGSGAFTVVEYSSYLELKTGVVAAEYAQAYLFSIYSGYSDASHYEDIVLAGTFNLLSIADVSIEIGLSNNLSAAALWTDHTVAAAALTLNRAAITLAFDSAGDAGLNLLYGSNAAAFNANSPAGIPFVEAVATGLTPTIFKDIIWQLTLKPDGIFVIDLYDNQTGNTFTHKGEWLHELSGDGLTFSYAIKTSTGAAKYLFADLWSVKALANNTPRDVL